MSRTALPMLLLCAVLSACTGTNAVSDGSGGPQLRQLDADSTGLLRVEDRPPVPTLRGDTVEGGTLDVADLRGQVVVINFWASWCAPCRAEAGFLNAVARDTEARGVRFVGVNVRDDRTAARRFTELREVPYPSLYDQPAVLLTRFRTFIPQTPPSTLLVDRRGRIAALFRGGVTETELSGPVQALAAETA